MKLWARYLLKKLGLTFLFVILCIFAVYVLVDLSIHGVRFLYKGSVQSLDLLLYYLRHFSMHLELFLPLSFLLSSLKVLFDLNSHFELVALQMAGLSRKRLLAPFFAFALFLSLLCYANSQWLAPSATNDALSFKSFHAKKKKKTLAEKQHLQALALEDDSELVFQRYDESSQELFDVFWIRSPRDIWHMKTLRIHPLPPEGRFVDHLVRNKLLEKAESFDRYAFKDLPIAIETAPKPFVPYESRSLSTLFHESLYASSNKATIRTHLHYKLAMPLLSFLALLAIAPAAIHFSRNRPMLLILAMSLFGFITTMILFDSLLILGENQVLPSWISMWTPIFLIFAFAFPKFSRL